MKIKVVDKNNEILAGVNVTLEVRNNLIELKSDQKGMVEVKDAEENDTIKYYANKDDVTELKFSKDATVSLKINTPLRDMLFVVTDTDEKPVAETSFVFRYSDREIKKVSNHIGEIKLSNIPVNTEVKCFQINKSKEVINKHLYKCQSYKQSYKLVLENKKNSKDVKILFKDKNDESISNLTIRFKIDGEVFDEKIDNSFVVLKDIEEGTVIECKQMIHGKELPWQTYTCDADTKEFVLYCEQQSESSDSVPTSKSKMKFRLVNSNAYPIANAVIRFEIGDHVRNKYTNKNGEVETDELSMGDKFNVSVDLKGKKLSNDFIFQGSDEVQQLVLKNNNTKQYLIFSLLLLLVIIVVFYATKDFSYDTKVEKTDAKVSKKDTTIIHNYYFKLKDKADSKAIKGSLVKLYYADTVMLAYTNDLGNAKFKALEKKAPSKYEISKLGFITIKNSILKDSILSESMQKDTSIFINAKINKCNDVVKSTGEKVIYQTYKMQVRKGRFKIWFNFFKKLHDIKVYSGDVDNISKENLIFSSEKPLKGIYNCPYMKFDNKDGLVTVCIISKDAKSNWVSKVYCAKQVQVSN